MAVTDASSAVGAIFARAEALAATGDLSVTALIAAAEQLSARQAPVLAEALYRAWLRYNALHPLSYAVRFNFSVTLSDAGAVAEAHDQLRLSLLDKPDFAPARINLGSALERLGNRLGAIESWRGLAVQLAGVTGETVAHKSTALNQMGRVLNPHKSRGRPRRRSAPAWSSTRRSAR
ncbi:MAG: hypothetical protein WDN04_05915 [Rhodospirillales bacterium]